MTKCIIGIIAVLFSFLGANMLFADTTPDQFTFVDRSSVALSTLITSNTITVTGIDEAAAISITGGGAKYSVSTDGGSNWTPYSSSTPSTVTVNNQVRVQLTSAASYNTRTDATLTIGGVSDTFHVFTQPPPVANTWVQKQEFGGVMRDNAVGFSIGNKGYIGTGKDKTDNPFKKDFWEYDLPGNFWTQKTDFGGTARSGAVGFSIGSKGYIGTGYDNSYTFKKDFWEYDPAGNTWTQKADFGGGIEGTARDGAVGFSIGSKGYLGTGEYSSGSLVYYKDFWEYDPAAGTDGTWTRKADFEGTARNGAVGFSIGSKGYLGTGFGSLGFTKDFWEYNPATDTWIQKADFGGTARNGAVGFSIGSKGYIGTGWNGSTYYKDFWGYDPAAGTDGTWTQMADFGGADPERERRGAVGFSIGSRGYLGTGYDHSNPEHPTYHQDFYEYQPALAPSVTTGPATYMTEHSATLNGTVNPNGLSTTYYFEWGPTTSYGNTTPTQSAGSGTSDVAVSANLTGLTPYANYHYRLVATNGLGTTYGSDMSFIASVKAMPWLMLLLGN